VRVWAIGTIDSVARPDSSELIVLASQNHEQRLDSAFRQEMDGRLNYHTRNVRLAGVVVARGTDSCRVGIVAQGELNQPIPAWLFRLALKVVLPSLLGDFDGELGRGQRARKPISLETPDELGPR